MKRKELKTRLASLMVYLELHECTDAQTFISYRDMEKRLEEKYGKELRPSKNTIYEILREMVEKSEDLGIDVIHGNSRQGYALRSREFEEWEIDLFIEAVLNSKTLSAVDKKNLIDKCFNQLGYVPEKRVDEIYDYLFGKEKPSATESDTEKKKDVEETLADLSNAIANAFQAEVMILEHFIGSKRVNTFRFRKIIHPYRIFERNGSSYLIYGLIVKDRRFISYDRIEDIVVIKIKKDKVIPIKEIKGFEDGIDEKRLRKDPFGYLTRSDQETVIAELLISDDHIARISKKEVELFFNKNISFYHDKNREYVYINDDMEKCLNWFLLHSSEYRVISPEPLVKLMKAHTINMFKTYADSNLDMTEYQDEGASIRYMYRNKRDYLKTKTDKQVKKET